MPATANVNGLQQRCQVVHIKEISTAVYWGPGIVMKIDLTSKLLEKGWVSAKAGDSFLKPR